MKQAIFKDPLLLLLLVLCFGCSQEDHVEVRQKIKFDYDWSFSKGDFSNAYEFSFDATNWEKIDVPHDWSITDTFSKANPGSCAYATGGVGWYRKIFRTDGIPRNSKVSIEFGGVYMNSEIWINGHYLGKRPYGYISFNYDLTTYLDFNGENILAVKVDNSKQPSARWYTGSGIFRHVWLVVTDRLHIARHGITAITATDGDHEHAQVHIKTAVVNENESAKSFDISNELYSRNGKMVASSKSSANLAPSASKEIAQSIRFNQPELWSPENPYLYALKTRILCEGNTVDSMVTKIGIRTIGFTSEKGFYLNGKNLKIMGVNNHSDLGALGAAINDKVLLRRLHILKDMGCNAIRTAHNPPCDELLDMCDSLGFMVMDEAFDEWLESWPFGGIKKPEGKSEYGYHLYFNEWAEKDLTELIQRDRNHPSIILWSVGNEIPDACFEKGVDRLKRLMAIVRENDTTRPVTSGITHMHLANESGYADALDVTGYNGGGGSCFMYEKDHKNHPGRIMIATEVPHSLQTRGIYRTKTCYIRGKDLLGGVEEVPDLTEEEVFKDVSRFYCSSYDNAMVRLGARDSWRKTRSLPYMSGEFRWTGFDYLGESVAGWPARIWNFGIIDMCGFPKDTYYFYQSQWTRKPMVHIFPHWNWKGKEGVCIPVVAYSNCESVELSLNGKSLGEKSMKGKMDLVWQVPYQPGTLSAEGRIDGKTVYRTQIVTAGEAKKIRMTADREYLTTDRQDVLHLEVDILDQKDLFVPDANNRIKFKIEGDVSILGIDNGDPLNSFPFDGNEITAFNGKCLLIVKSGGKTGKAVIRATSPGLETAQIEFCIKKE